MISLTDRPRRRFNMLKSAEKLPIRADWCQRCGTRHRHAPDTGQWSTVSLVCQGPKGEWAAHAASVGIVICVMWKTLTVTYVDHYRFIQKLIFFACWKLYILCTTRVFSERWQMFTTNVKAYRLNHSGDASSSSEKEQKQPDLQRAAWPPGTCVRPQNPNITDLDPVQQNVTHRSWCQSEMLLDWVSAGSVAHYCCVNHRQSFTPCRFSNILN